MTPKIVVEVQIPPNGLSLVMPYLQELRGLKEDLRSAGIGYQEEQKKEAVTIAAIVIAILGEVAAHYITRLADGLEGKLGGKGGTPVNTVIEYKGIPYKIPDQLDELKRVLQPAGST